jgi:glyoxylase-like metal-dependent hydrolase (beta-lactamase superfamily II)
MSLIDYFAMNIVPRMYRGKGALHPAETGVLTDEVSCIREYDVNIFIIRKGETLIAIDAGYKNYAGFLQECRKINLDPSKVQALFLTHADPDHAGGLDIEQKNYFENATVYLGNIEENYLTNVYHRKKIGPFGLKNSVTIKDGYHMLNDGDVTTIGDIKIQTILLPGHTLGHLAYLIDDELLFTGDSIALNKDGGWCFFDIFNYDSKLNIQSLLTLKDRLDFDSLRYVFTSHNGFTADVKNAFSHIDVIPEWKQRGFIFDETAPYDCFSK